MTKRIVILSDIQSPYHDKAALKAATNFIGEYQPDQVIQIGDLLDLPQPARWSKDTRAEFEGSVYEDSKYTRKFVIEPLRAVYDGPIGVLEGNHDLRARAYLAKYAPALEGTKQFHFENLLDFDSYGITKLDDFYELTPEWVVTHGHLGKISLSQNAGTTALNAAKKFGKSLIMGHTHRLGKTHHTIGYDGKIMRQVTGVEVGNLMDMKQAQYLQGGTANWQQGFAVAYVDGVHAQVDTIEILNRRFVVEHEVYKV